MAKRLKKSSKPNASAAAHAAANVEVRSSQEALPAQTRPANPDLTAAQMDQIARISQIAASLIKRKTESPKKAVELALAIWDEAAATVAPKAEGHAERDELLASLKRIAESDRTGANFLREHLAGRSETDKRARYGDFEAYRVNHETFAAETLEDAPISIVVRPAEAIPYEIFVKTQLGEFEWDQLTSLAKSWRVTWKAKRQAEGGVKATEKRLFKRDENLPQS